MKTIAFDAASNGTSGASSPLTWTHTTSGTDRYLVVAIISSGGDTVTAVSYNGAGMTQVSKQAIFSGKESYIYVLPNPTSGANSVSISFSAGTILGCSASYNNVSSSGQPDSSGTFTQASGSSTYSESLTSTSDNDWHVSAIFESDIGGISAGASTSVRSGNLNATVNASVAIADNNAAIHPAGSNTINLSAGSTAGWASNGVTLKAAPDATILTATQASYTLTAQAMAPGLKYPAVQASYTLTTFSATLTNFYYYTNQTKNTSVMTNVSKHSSSWSNQSKNSSSFTNITKH